MKRARAQLDREIAESLSSISVKRLWAWLPKLEETVADVDEGRLSHNPGLAVRVSRLDTPRGAYFIIDGHHRVVEAILAGKSTINVEVDLYVPRIERAGNAYQNYVDNKVNVLNFLQRRRTPSQR